VPWTHALRRRQRKLDANAHPAFLAETRRDLLAHELQRAHDFFIAEETLAIELRQDAIEAELAGQILEAHRHRVTVGLLVCTASPRQSVGTATERRDETGHRGIQTSGAERRAPSRKPIAKRKEHVYLSYSDEDSDLASKILGRLKSRFTTVFNPYDFERLFDFEKMTDQLLNSADVGVALLSHNYLRNKKCLSESQQMADLQIRGVMQHIIPVKLHNDVLDFPEWMVGKR
jgi:hypothetical protein